LGTTQSGCKYNAPDTCHLQKISTIELPHRSLLVNGNVSRDAVPRDPARNSDEWKSFASAE
jgi:hypothetical protein